MQWGHWVGRSPNILAGLYRQGTTSWSIWNAAADCFLSYGRCRDKDRGPDDALARERRMNLVEIYCDVSYAPQGEKSVQGIVGMVGGGVVQWESSRQSCMALSTAEAELLAYIESSVMGDSLQALLGEVLGCLLYTSPSPRDA